MAHKLSLLLASAVLMVAGLGCTIDDGWLAGVEDGIAGAVAALITAPVDAWIAATFP